MEAATARRRPDPAQYMPALEKAKRRKLEVAQLKRDIKSRRLSAAAALKDPRAVGAVTVGTILLAQFSWGGRRATRFVAHIGCQPSIMAKRVEDLTDRQRIGLAQALSGDPRAIRPNEWL